MKITDFSVDRPVTITMLVMIVMVVGAIALSRLGMDLLPDIDYPTLSVMVRYPGAPSEEIETMVARPYEGALAGVNGVKKIRSISQEDVCYFLVDFVWGTDLDAAAADIREAVAMVEPYLPPDVEDPLVIKFNLTSMPLAAYAVSGMEDTVVLRDLMEDVVQDRLERLDGVAQAPFIGGRVEEVQVDVDRAALEGSGVTLDQVVMALGAQNLNLPAGRQVQGGQEYLLRTLGEFRSLDQLRDAAVGISRHSGTPIRLADLARVDLGTRDVRNFVRTSGYEALMLIVMKESGANPLAVHRLYVDRLEELKTQLPAGVEFGLLFDMGLIIKKMASGVVQNGVIGAFLAVVIMWLFLRNLRPTLTIAVVIPLSLLATFIPIYAMGETLNMMTMGGLVLGVGMLVDNAVVVIENIFRHIEEGKGRHDAAKVGAREVGMAITASTLTTMVVFLPILFSRGLAGQLARGLAVTVAAALFASLFVALTIVPMLASVFFSRASKGSVLDEGRAFRRFKEWYRARLAWCLGHWKTTLGGATGLVVVSLALLPLVGAEFMPENNDPVIMAKISFPVGTPLAQTAAASQRVEEVFGRFPDVVTVGTQLGVDENDPGGGLSDSNPSGVHEAVLFARLKDADQREVHRTSDLKARMREAIPEVDGMEFQFVDMGGGMGSTHPIELRLFGSDLEVLREWANRIADRIAVLPGLVDVDTTSRVAKPEAHVVIDRARAAAYGLTVGQVAATLKTATLGTVATRFREGGQEYDVRVRYAAPWRSDLEALRHVLVPLPVGGTVPLDQLATVERGEGPVKIVREDQTRVVSVVADLEGTNLGDAMGAVDTALKPLLADLPQGYTVEYGGQFEDMMEAFIQLLAALTLAVLLVYMVMASQFESFSHPITIMFTMPLAVVGVILAFFITRTTLSVPTFVGVIMLAGIVVNNGIVLVDYVNQLRQAGRGLQDAVLEGAATRLRPVLITSLTTIIAMVPMAMSRKEGAEIMAPLALTIIGGLAAGSVLTLLVVPVVYTLVDGASRRASRRLLRLLHRDEDSGAPAPVPPT